MGSYIYGVKRTDASFVRSAGLLSFLTLMSRVLGLVRESVCAYYFGAGAIWSDFSIAFRIPNLSRRLFGEGALSAAFIPVMSERLHSDGREAAARLTGRVLFLLGAILLGMVCLGELILWVAGRYSSDLSISRPAVMLPYLFFTGLVALMGGALNVLGQFGRPAMMPLLFNVTVIAGVVAGALWAAGEPLEHVFVLAAVVLVAGAAQLVVQVVMLVRADFKPVLEWYPSDPAIQRIMARMAPMVVGLAAVQLNSLADLLVAKMLIERVGGPAVLSYAERLYQLPIGLFGAAIATAIFPELARQAQASDLAAFGRTLQKGLRLALFVGLPASAALFALRLPLVRVLYERGAFAASDTTRVAGALGWYGLGVWAYITQQVLVRGYYSRGNTRTPMRVAIAVVGLNLVLNIVLVRWYEESGIALATAISAAVQVGLLATLFDRGAIPLGWWAVVDGAARSLAASAAMCGAIVVLNRLWSGPGMLHLGVLIGIGFVCYLLASKILGCSEWELLSEALQRRRDAR